MFFYHTRKAVSLRLFGAHVTILPLMNAENTGTCGFQKGGTANPMISSEQIAKNYDIAGEEAKQQHVQTGKVGLADAGNIIVFCNLI